VDDEKDNEEPCREARDLKEVVAEQTLELRLLKKSMFDSWADQE
jgi:transposase